MMMGSLAACVCVCLILHFDMSTTSAQSVNQTKTLLSTVLQGYDRRVRPTLNQSLPTKVDITLLVIGLEEVNEVKSWFSVTGFLILSWFDELITWDPGSYDGIDSLEFPVSEVWFPDLILTYPYEQFGFTYDNWVTVRINYRGRALFTPGTVYKSKCSIDVTYFPFDTQICDIGFISTIYEPNQFQLTPPSPHVYTNHGYFTEHGEWSFVKNYTRIQEDDDKNMVIYTFHFQRNPGYFVVNIIIPIIIMSLLNIFIFVLPPQSGERISFGITVLLAIAVFLTIVGENLPKTSKNMSLLSYYLVVNMSMSTIICICAILNVHVYFKENIGCLPWWAKLAVFLTCSFGKYSKTNKVQSASTAEDENEKNKEMEDNPSGDGQSFIWEDISIMLDKLCFVCFLVIELVSTTTLFIVLTQN